jgi:hypothetical protein
MTTVTPPPALSLDPMGPFAPSAAAAASPSAPARAARFAAWSTAQTAAGPRPIRWSASSVRAQTPCRGSSPAPNAGSARSRPGWAKIARVAGASFAIGAAGGCLATAMRQPSAAAAPRVDAGSAAAGLPRLPSEIVLPAAAAEAVVVANAPAAPAGEADPMTVLQQWMAEGSGDSFSWEVSNALGELSKTDPYAVLALVDEAPRFPRRLDALAVPLSAIVQRDPAFARQWLVEHLDRLDRDTVAVEMIDLLDDEAPATALEVAMIPEVSVGSWQLHSGLWRLASERPEEALRFFSMLPEDSQNDLVPSLVRGWFQNDPEAAMRWCETQRGTDREESAIASVLAGTLTIRPEQLPEAMARLGVTPEALGEIDLPTFRFDLDAQLALAAQLPPNGRRCVVGGVVADRLSVDPDLAIQLARESLGPDEAKAAIANALETWAASDRRSAVAWAGTVTDPELRDAVAVALPDRKLEEDPAGFLADAEALPPGSVPTQHLERAIESVTRTHPDVAAAWVAQHPDVADGVNVRYLVWRWMDRDANSATAWVRAQPPGKLRDIALRASADRLAGNGDYAAAGDLVGAISDPRRRLKAQNEVFWAVGRRDPAAAASWPDMQSLSPEVRENWKTLVLPES